MNIEIAPSKTTTKRRQTFSAKLMKDKHVMAEIVDAPFDIATRWADLMKQLHDDQPQIKRIGVCIYCGSDERVGQFCGGCARVFRG
jgi:hypothetical protein